MDDEIPSLLFRKPLKNQRIPSCVRHASIAIATSFPTVFAKKDFGLSSKHIFGKILHIIYKISFQTVAQEDFTMVTFEVPPTYGYVVLGVGIGTFITNQYLAAGVMSARSKYNIPYPNCYAVPGYHEKADDFNRAQRAHQNFLEGFGSYTVTALLGGLKHPVANAVGAVFYCIGSILFQIGYIDNSLDVKMARYKKGGAIKFIGIFTALYSTGALAYDLITAK